MKLTILLVALAIARAQRPSFAGIRPIGYPSVETTAGLADRFGEVDGTTQRLPIEANGDRELIDRLSKLPVDKQPFWFINWQALEAHRQNPQTYPQKPNTFVDPALSGNSGNSNPNVGQSSNFQPNAGGNFGNGNPSLGTASNIGNTNTDRNFPNRNPNFGTTVSNFGNVNNVGSGNSNPDRNSIIGGSNVEIPSSEPNGGTGGQLFTNVGNNANPNLSNINSEPFNTSPSFNIPGNLESGNLNTANRFGNSNFETTTPSYFANTGSAINSGNSNFGNTVNGNFNSALNSNKKHPNPTVNNRNNFQKPNIHNSAFVTDKYHGGIEMNTYGL